MKEVDIKIRTCYYFDDIVNDIVINFNDILLDEKLCKNISVHGIWDKTSTGLKPLRITFNKIDGFIRVNLDI